MILETPTIRPAESLIGDIVTETWILLPFGYAGRLEMIMGTFLHFPGHLLQFTLVFRREREETCLPMTLPPGSHRVARPLHSRFG